MMEAAVHDRGRSRSEVGQEQGRSRGGAGRKQAGSRLRVRQEQVKGWSGAGAELSRVEQSRKKAGATQELGRSWEGAG